MDTDRLAAVLGRTARPAGVGLAAALGGGLLYVPNGVAQGTGPQAPLAYLIAGGGVVCLAVAFGVLASGPFGDRGPVYGAVSRVWGSRRLGALAAWPALAGYVALLALLAEWLGRFAPLPVGAGAYVEGTLGAPTGLAAMFGVGSLPPLAADVLAIGVCVLALAVHLAGPRRAALAVALPAWGVVVGVGGLLLAAFVPGVGEFVAGNFDPMYPTFGLQRTPIRSLLGGIGVALFAFLGIEAAAYAVAYGGTATDAWADAVANADADADADASQDAAADADADATQGAGATQDAAASEDATATASAGAAPVVAATVAVALVTLTSFVALGVIDWVRLNLADIPAADAVGAYLPVDPVALTAVVSGVTGVAGLVALGVPASRTLAGLAELYPPLARGPAEPPVIPLVAVYGVAAALAVGDLVAPALYVAVPGLALSYLAVAVTAAAMPTRRPDLWAACGSRPSGTLGRGALLGAVVAAVAFLGLALASDPATTLGLTLHRVALAVFEFQLVSDPLGGVVPALVVWELVGLGLFVVLRDYRAYIDAELAPLDAAGGDERSDNADNDADPVDGDPAAEP